MSDPQDFSNSKSVISQILIGIIVAIIGGVIVAYIIQDARFTPSQTPTDQGAGVLRSAETFSEFATEPTVTVTATSSDFVEPSPIATIAPTPTLIHLTPATLGGNFNGTIAEGEIDEYGFVISTLEIVQLRVTPIGPFNHILSVLDLNRRRISAASNSGTQNANMETVLVFAPEPNTSYIIRVQGINSSVGGSYTLFIENRNDE